jgi:hypothetical protein
LANFQPSAHFLSSFFFAFFLDYQWMQRIEMTAMLEEGVSEDLAVLEFNL